jgi:hypothetical protein
LLPEALRNLWHGTGERVLLDAAAVAAVVRLMERASEQAAATVEESGTSRGGNEVGATLAETPEHAAAAVAAGGLALLRALSCAHPSAGTQSVFQP